ncbi:PREDICTED: uncharacterized protein LOC109182618 [Ipomoea nil]|uniref:uncharacterized protein LOC109182618 n=1 Tax=Ipomoea nil TaxID=35883 RepID=UPI000900B697|nr:PREDICTED: uncharacterized protein LOC109182618 [Ipomoea nil]
MQLPPSVPRQRVGQVCKLNKSLYGLKQASRQWNTKLSIALQSMGFKQSIPDNSMFTKGEGHSFMALLVYVDDIVVASADIKAIQEIKGQLNAKFQIKDLGSLKYFLGLEVARQGKGINNVCQRKYTLELLNDTGFTDCKPIHSPTVPSHNSVSILAAHRVLRYIKAAPAQGMFFPSSSDLKLKAFSNSDWGACVDTRRFLTGFCIFLGNALVSWKSKKQVTVSKSSSEAEYRALAATTCEVQGISYLLNELEINHSGPAAVYCDGKSAIAIAKNPVFHEHTKHIELDCHLVRETLSKGVIKLFHVGSKSQLADTFTKTHCPSSFHKYISKLGLFNM